MISLVVQKREIKGRDGPIGRTKVFTRDFQKHVICRVELRILICIVDTVSSIYSFELCIDLQDVVVASQFDFRSSWNLRNV